MNLVFKKYFWAVKLVGIALLALLVAGGVNDWIGSKMFAVPTAPGLGTAEPANAGETPAWGRVAAAEDATAELRSRHVFDLDPDDLAEAPVDEPTDEPKTEEPPKAEGELEESTLAIDLIGTMVAPEQTSSMATLQVEGENKLGWVGSEFLDGKAKIVKIAQRHIVIQEDTKLTVVRLWDDKGKQAAARPGVTPAGRPDLKRPMAPRTATPVASNTPNPSDRNARADRIRNGIKKTGAYDFQVERGMINEELKDLGKLQSEARVVPNYQNQKYDGFKLVGVRPGSLYRALGIRSGDVIKSVNGTAIDSPTKALELFEQLKSSSDIKVDIERRGQPKTLSYNIQ
ncbi:MAG: PDZ domain-containing protein [Deltaproteobacteria bacterium]|nr:MAG: PDZ domain-containing protein [Deltaproteobacteria bacterium]